MQPVSRFLNQKITKLLELFPCVAVIGPRQCGKSTLVRNMLPEWRYYDLERPDDYRLITSDPLGFFSRRTEKIIIDEAQQYPELFSILRGVIDNDRKQTGRFLLTGSSSPEIVKGLSESLAGRIATVELWPFKAAEFYQKPLPEIYSLLSSSNVDLIEVANLKKTLQPNQIYQHWLLGGYPEVRIKSETEAMFHGLWMDEYFGAYIRRDIARLFPRINSHNFRLFVQTLSHHSGAIINQSEIARALEVSSVTAKEYLEIIHGTFVWRNLRSYENNRLKRVQKMPKGFFRDSGLLHHQLKIRSVDDLLLHPCAAGSFESFAIEEIIRGFQCLLQPSNDYYFYRTRDKSEVGLIIEGSSGPIPIEIKLGYRINQRMLTSLKAFLMDTKAPFGILVNNGEKIEFISDDILQIPAIYF